MKHFFWAISFFLISFSSAFALDPACFRESASFSPPSGSSSFFVRFPSFDEDVFFIQSGSLIPFSLVSKGKNPPIPLSVTGVSIDERPIFDGDPRTYSVIDPYELSLRDMVLVFDLGKVYPVGSLTSEIRYHSSAPVDISISKDGKTYISTTLWSLTSFEFRYVRITFPKQIKTTTIPTIHTVLFFETDEASFFVKSPGTTLITAYR